MKRRPLAKMYKLFYIDVICASPWRYIQSKITTKIMQNIAAGDQYSFIQLRKSENNDMKSKKVPENKGSFSGTFLFAA